MSVPEIIHAGALMGTYIVERARDLAASGARAVEVGLPLDGAQGLTPMECAGRVHRALKGAGIAVRVVHAEFGGAADLSVADDAARQGAIERHKLALETCAVLNSRLLVIHAGHHYTEGDADRAVDRAADSISQLLDHAADCGVTLAVENLPPGHVLDSPQAVREFVEGINSPKLRACYDSGHANVTGDAAEAVDAMAPVLASLHLHDNDGTADQHRMLGEGTIDWKAVGDRVRAVGFEGPALLELRLPEGHTAASMRSRALELLGY
jgi:sugar phosphate isomerase/epimerase